MNYGWLVGQQIVNGLVNGSVYVLIAVGFTLCMGVLKLINVSQGHLYLLGSFFTFQAVTWWFGASASPSEFAAAILFAVALVTVIGIGVHFIGVWPVFHRGQVAPMITTIAIAFLIENIAIISWPGSGRTFQTDLQTHYRNWGQIYFTDQKIVTFVAGLVLVALLYIFLQKTKAGKAMRATTQNEVSASLMGINPEFMRALAMALSAALAAAGGGLVGPLFTIEPNAGLGFLFKAMMVVMIGGMGNVPGAIVGGLFLGLLEALVGGLWSPAWVNVIVFAVIIGVLTIRPSGVLGSKVDLTH